MSSQVCENEIPQHEEEFREIRTYIVETRHPGLVSRETQSGLERSCKVIEKRRNAVNKQMRESHNKLVL